MNRRNVLRAALAASLLPLGACERRSQARRGVGIDDGRPNVLVLGGTGFIGPHVVEAIETAGYRVTLFNRGRSNTHLFSELELLVGDRNGDLVEIAAEVARGRRWQSVVDLSGYTAAQVAATAEMLADATEQYLFLSTVAAYAGFRTPNTEDSPLEPPFADARSASYGQDKAQAERELLARAPEHATLIRPTYVAGPGDTTQRFTYWPVRVARGGEMLVPAPPDRPFQFIDVRDLAAFVARCVANTTFGAYNAVIPAGSYTFADLLRDCQQATGVAVEPAWMDAEFIARHDLVGNPLPLWEPPGGDRHMAPAIDGTKAAAAGLLTRSPLETVRATYEWWLAEGSPTLRVGLTAEREAELLAEMRASRA